MCVGHEVIACDDSHFAIAAKESVQVCTSSFSQPPEDRTPCMRKFDPEFRKDWLPLDWLWDWAAMREEVNLPYAVGG